MKLLLVDDEPLALRRLHKMITTIADHTVVALENPMMALEVAKKENFDAAFLDIEMPGMGGVELAHQLLAIQPDLFLIFQTAYRDYALDAFAVGAVDYLLKPAEASEVDRALHRVSLYRKEPTSVQLMIKDVEGYLPVKAEEIVYVQADLDDVIIRTVKALYNYPATMTRMQKLLEPHGFIRIHRTFLINSQFIKRVVSIGGGRLRFYFHGIGESLESSREGARLYRSLFS
ncbi:MAG: LytTR family DNA-binding domain-containing protein [Campylobacterales bacterium]